MQMRGGPALHPVLASSSAIHPMGLMMRLSSTSAPAALGGGSAEEPRGKSLSKSHVRGCTIGLNKIQIPGAAGGGRRLTVCRAEGEDSLSAKEGRNFGELLVLTGMFAAWYGTNIMFNIYNKQLFSVFKYPFTTTLVQFLIGSLLSLTFWATGIVKRPNAQFDLTFVKNVAPLALIHVVGNVLTNISLGLVAVSFTHTVKAAEPFFSALFSYLFLGDVPSFPVLLTLLPIVGGVVIASASEASFNWGGFLSAIASNITFQSRNVLSKKLMISKGGIDKMSMFQLLTIMSFIILLPIAILLEGMPALPASLAALGLGTAAIDKVYERLLLAGLCFHGYQQLSYLILSRMSPVSHSVGNSCKRVAVIVASLLFFHNPISTQNAVGTAMALAGVFLYSQVKRLQGDKKKAAAASSE